MRAAACLAVCQRQTARKYKETFEDDGTYRSFRVPPRTHTNTHAHTKHAPRFLLTSKIKRRQKKAHQNREKLQ